MLSIRTKGLTALVLTSGLVALAIGGDPALAQRSETKPYVGASVVTVGECSEYSHDLFWQYPEVNEPYNEVHDAHPVNEGAACFFDLAGVRSVHIQIDDEVFPNNSFDVIFWDEATHVTFSGYRCEDGTVPIPPGTLWIRVSIGEALSIDECVARTGEVYGTSAGTLTATFNS